jgi:hypothetical protein
MALIFLLFVFFVVIVLIVLFIFPPTKWVEWFQGGAAKPGGKPQGKQDGQ